VTAFRSFLFSAVFYLLIMVMAVLALPFLATPGGSRAVARVWSRLSLWALRVITGLKVEVRGLENLPEAGGLIAAKHQSALETFALVPYVGDFAFILKRELLRLPFFGWYATRAGMIGVDRSAGASALRKMVSDSRDAVAEGRRVIIFPEGTRQAPGDAPDYKPGIAQLYAKLNTSCIPVAVNTGLFWPRGSSLRHPGTAVIEFLEPIPPGLDSRTFRAVLQESIETATARLLAEAAPHGIPYAPASESPPAA
jgi:1-acyl-sn-glycerol-3-phosphate acyltransferase